MQLALNGQSIVQPNRLPETFFEQHGQTNPPACRQNRNSAVSCGANIELGAGSRYSIGDVTDLVMALHPFVGRLESVTYGQGMSSPTNQIETLEKLLRAILDAQIGCPVFPAEGIISRQALKDFFRVGQETLTQWHKLGLKAVGPGLRSYYYFAKDIHQLFQEHQDQPRLRAKKTRRKKT